MIPLCLLCQNLTITALANAKINAIIFQKEIFSWKNENDNAKVTIGLKLKSAEVTPTSLVPLRRVLKITAPITPNKVVKIAKTYEDAVPEVILGKPPQIKNQIGISKAQTILLIICC